MNQMIIKKYAILEVQNSYQVTVARTFNQENHWSSEKQMQKSSFAKQICSRIRNSGK
jgi:hypothetical protein